MIGHVIITKAVIGRTIVAKVEIVKLASVFSNVNEVNLKLAVRSHRRQLFHISMPISYKTYSYELL